MLGLSPLSQIGGSDGQGSDRGPGLLDASEVWTDPLDDMSHVYMATAVEVVSGEVRLETLKDNGWIASEIIPAKPGYKYDFVLLDAITPGNSTVEVSILDATQSSTEIGYANETIDNYERLEGVYQSTRDIEPTLYPEIRIQVNLVEVDGNKPTLQAWSLYYVPRDEWRDEFLGGWKMSDDGGLNFTGDSLEVNTTSKSGKGPGGYRTYPTVALTGGPWVFYSNTARDDYENGLNLAISGTGPSWGVCFGDLNNDGYQDLVHSARDKSSILWGDDTGKYSTTGAIDITSHYYMRPATGDVNGDGWNDIAISSDYPTAGTFNRIYLNKGDGTFNATSDITFSTSHQSADIADVNYDGYEDVMFGSENTAGARVYFGGPGGPDTTADISFPAGNYWIQEIEDLNGDGYWDVYLGAINNDRLTVFLGDENGIDTTPEFTFNNIDGPSAGGVGDIDGDGYMDLVAHHIVSGTKSTYIYTGDASGWSANRKHKVVDMTGLGKIAVGDVDKDGYDDILQQGTYNSIAGLHVFYGGPSLPTSAGSSMTGGGSADIAISIPRGSSGGGARIYRGTFTTEAISLPNDQWKWDMLNLEGTTPKNTTMSVTVLDDTESPIPGYEALPDWNVDLLNIDRSRFSTIKVRVDVTSELNNTTPILDKLTIKWMDKMTWRDQFYGNARSERLMGVDVLDGILQTDITSWSSPQLVFSSLRNDTGYNWRSQAYLDTGGLDFLSRSPMAFSTKGAAATDVADVNGDGFLDIAFAIHQTSDTNFAATSPLFLNSATGWRLQADHSFPTTGAADILLEDLNDDSYVDVVFAQEMEAQGDYTVNSTLFWGSADGWSTTPDVEFITTGAVDVEAFDHDGDDDLDLVFACYKEIVTDIDSMVFTQGPDGFNGSSPSLFLATKAARAVAAADINKDTFVDLVFANSFAGGLAEIPSWIYWGNNAGGFDSTPTGLPTVGAEDVKIADVNGDTYLDIVFANAIDDSLSREVSSYVYLNDQSGGFSITPDWELPATGAVAVTIGDLDGTGWKDLVFACQRNDTSFNIPSVIYLGGSSGWASTPDIVLPTEGASDAMVVQLTRKGYGGYISKAITPDPLDDPGMFHTLRYEAILGGSRTGTIQLVDAVTEEVLAELPLGNGPNEWTLEGLFRYKEHPSIRVVVMGEGLDQPGSFEVDNLWLNWSKRVHANPVILGMDLSASEVFRTKTIELWVNATDEYDLPTDLAVTVEHALNGTDIWETNLLSPSTYRDSTKRIQFTPRVDSIVGHYDFRVMVTDFTDGDKSGHAYFYDMLVVQNNLPTAPGIILTPARATTTTPLQVDISQASWDVESSGLTYIYSWYLDGVLQEDLTDNMVSSANTTKDQNWSVEVRAWDLEDMSPPAVAWRVIENAGPAVKQTLSDPMFDEDTVDSEWLDLTDAFWDPDGDALTWTVNPTPQHLTVDIDPATGQVTITPQENWNGNEEVTFIVSDGELQAAQTVNVTVMPVNDIPRFATVNGAPVGDDPVEITIQQGGLLEIDVLVLDVEGDELLFDTNSTIIDLDGTTGSISWQPDNDEVGKLHFSLSVITSPRDGDKFEEGMLISLRATSSDPDTQYGQVLNFKWSSNLEGVIGNGRSIDINLTEVGTHIITLTVSDGEFEKMATVTIEVEAKEVIDPTNGDNGDGGGSEPFNYGLILIIVVVLVIVGVVFFVATTRKKTDELEAADEEEYKRDHMVRAHAAVKDAADTLEAGKDEPTADVDDLLAELEEVDVDSTAVPDMSLSMEAKKTEAASAQTMALFADEKAEPAMSEEEAEQLRVDNLKRKFQNAIGRLPYGIPSEELRDWDVEELAMALASGEKKMTPDGRETTEIDGRWYFSDSNDTGSFLKEHGAKPKEKPKKKAAEVTTDKAALLAKLEERFILGEISEDAYNKLVEKYSKEE
jgi:uncharacterized membrane protein